MNTYGAVRRFACGVITVLGLCAALFLWTAPRVVVTFVLVALIAGMGLHLVSQSRATPSDGTPGSPNLTALVAPAARVGLGGVALGGIATISVATAVFLLLAGAASSPRLVAALGRGARRPAPSPADATPTPTDAIDGDLAAVAREVDAACLRTLSKAELCHAWRLSYSSLVHATSIPLRAAVVASRQAYLDEMEARDPAGLSAWLASGARAASGPERYLSDAS